MNHMDKPKMGRPKKERALDKAIMVRVEPDIYARIARLTEADDRTVAYIARRAMEKGLPLLEQEMAERGKTHE